MIVYTHTKVCVGFLLLSKTESFYRGCRHQLFLPFSLKMMTIVIDMGEVGYHNMKFVTFSFDILPPPPFSCSFLHTG